MTSVPRKPPHALSLLSALSCLWHLARMPFHLLFLFAPPPPLSFEVYSQPCLFPLGALGKCLPSLSQRRQCHRGSDFRPPWRSVTSGKRGATPLPADDSERPSSTREPIPSFQSPRCSRRLDSFTRTPRSTFTQKSSPQASTFPF